MLLQGARTSEREIEREKPLFNCVDRPSLSLAYVTSVSCGGSTNYTRSRPRLFFFPLSLSHPLPPFSLITHRHSRKLHMHVVQLSFFIIYVYMRLNLQLNGFFFPCLWLLKTEIRSLGSEVECHVRFCMYALVHLYITAICIHQLLQMVTMVAKKYVVHVYLWG